MNIKELTIAHIGLGRMGAGIAKNIQATGCHFVVYNRSTEKMQPFVATGAKSALTAFAASRGIASSPPAKPVACAGVETIFSLPGLGHRMLRRSGREQAWTRTKCRPK